MALQIYQPAADGRLGSVFYHFCVPAVDEPGRNVPPQAALPANVRKAFGLTHTRNMAMIGDTPSTDIRGANGVGIASVLVEAGGGLVDLGGLPEGDMPGYRLQSLAP